MSIPKQARNTPCTCGSGNKFKHCCENRKDRETYLESDLGFAHNIFQDGIIKEGNYELNFTENSSRVIFNNKSIDADFAIKESYKRPGKNDNVLRQFPVESFSVDHLDNNSINNLCPKFDLIFAVDTNTVTIENKLLSVAFSFVCKYSYISENTINCDYGHFKNFTYESLNSNEAEKKGIYDTIQSIMSHPRYSETLKLAIVSDTDLGQHQKINNKEIPILNDFFLPANFRLLYASADSGNENFLNRLIKLCDKACTLKLQMLRGV